LKLVNSNGSSYGVGLVRPWCRDIGISRMHILNRCGKIQNPFKYSFLAMINQ
jgi:hypothetical protein